MHSLRPSIIRLLPQTNRYRLDRLSFRQSPRSSFTPQLSPPTVRLTSPRFQERTIMAIPRAPFLSSIEQCLSFDSPWGFVIYRTTSYAPTETTTWQAFQHKLDCMIQETFDSAAGPVGEIAAARKSWTMRWEEDSTMAEWTLDDVKKHYESLLASKTLPDGQSHPLCLVATSAAVQSVLDAPSPLPRYEYSSGGRGAPYLVGIDCADVDEMDEEDEEKYEGHFNVSVQCLVDGLWPILIEQMCDVEELGRGLKKDEVWGM